MAYIPFITTIDADQEPVASAEIVEFPRRVTVQAKLRSAIRSVARCEDSIANDDPNSPDLRESVRATSSVKMLDFWNNELRKAEAEAAMWEADDAITFGGRVYQAHRSSNGAN